MPITLITGERTTITVTAFDAAGNSTSQVITVRYIIYNVTEVIGKGIAEPTAAATVDSPDGTYIYLPAGAVARSTLISIYRIAEEDIPTISSDDLEGTPFARVFGPKDITFLKWVRIRIPYYRNVIEMKANQVGENPDVFESRLAIFYWDGMRWHRVSEAAPQRGSGENVGYITAWVNHGGLFAILEDTRTAPTAFKFYLTNNPFSPNGDGRRDHTVFYYELPKAGEVTIKVYDLAGDLVRVLAENISQEAGYHEATWTGENDFGNYVGSGLYIFKFYVKFTDGSTKTIIKPVGVIK